MKRTNLCVTLMSAVLCLSTQAADVKKVGNIVTIRPDGGQAKVIQLEVINDNIIRVRATSKDELPVKPASLMIVPQATYKGSVTVNDGSEAVEVKARNVWAVVSKAKGEVWFYDALNGKWLLKEAADGKLFKDFTVPEREYGIKSTACSGR